MKKLFSAVLAAASKKARLVFAAIAIAGAGAAALAQVAIPLIGGSHPFADLVHIIPNGQVTPNSVYTPWANVTNVYGYYKAGTATANQNLTIPANATFVQFANASAMANLYLYLPAAPFDGARECLFSIGGVTAMTMYAGLTTQTLNNAVTSLTANTGVCYLYSVSNTAWDRN